MGEKDITEKHLEAYNDVFADIVNVLLFKGNQLMKEQDLESAAKDTMFKADGKLHQQERDVSKFWKNGEVRISILGFENQTIQDTDMPLRVISYDGASYKEQLLDKKKDKNKDTKKKNLYPVVTLVLYFGIEDKWTAPKHLLDCFKVPEELKPFVSDYKINVFNIAWLSDETIDMFKSDFKIIAKYFQTRRLKEKFTGTNEEIKHMDALLKMLTALTGDKAIEERYNASNLNEGGFTMIKFVETFKDEGKAEIIHNLIESKAGSLEQIAAWVKLPVKEVKKLAAKKTAQA